MTTYDKLCVNVCHKLDSCISSIAFAQQYVLKDTISSDTNFNLYVSSLRCLRDRIDEALMRIEAD